MGLLCKKNTRNYMKKILVVDWLDKFGGAERVIQSIDKVFKFDKYYSLVNIMNNQDLNKTFNSKKVIVHVTGLQIFKQKFRFLLPLFPFYVKSINVDRDVSLIISSSHAVAKSICSDNALHISYFQARNLKYIWDEQSLYFNGIKSLFKIFIPALQRFDFLAAQKPDYLIANSKFVQNWIKKIYKRESTLIYPPVDIHDFDLNKEKEDYYVTVGRLVQYKRFDILVQVFNKLPNKKLLIIGDGSERFNLERQSNKNIVFTGYLDQPGVKQYISKAKCFIFAGVEDFGIAPVEAQACGTPVIALNKAGTAETVVNGLTGVYFNNQTEEDVINAINKFEVNYANFDPVVIRNHALQFGPERFEREIKEFVEEKYNNFRKQ